VIFVWVSHTVFPFLDDGLVNSFTSLKSKQRVIVSMSSGFSSSVLSSLSSQGFGSGVESLHQSAVGERVLLLLGVQNAVASNLS